MAEQFSEKQNLNLFLFVIIYLFPSCERCFRFRSMGWRWEDSRTFWVVSAEQLGQPHLCDTSGLVFPWHVTRLEQDRGWGVGDTGLIKLIWGRRCARDSCSYHCHHGPLCLTLCFGIRLFGNCLSHHCVGSSLLAFTASPPFYYSCYYEVSKLSRCH